MLGSVTASIIESDCLAPSKAGTDKVMTMLDSTRSLVSNIAACIVLYFNGLPKVVSMLRM